VLLLSICYPVKFLSNNFSVNVMWFYVRVRHWMLTHQENNHKQRFNK